MREDVARAIDRCERYGTNTIFCEHGFYDRQNYCQADRKGILHWSSWARHVTEPAPECGERRFNAVTNNRAIKPMSKRNGGYVLVLGQVSGDSQLNDSEVKGPLPLQRVLWPYFEGSQKNKFGLTGYFRPHPLCSNVITNRHHKTLKQIPQQCNEVRDYKKTKGGTGLKDALKGARFVITINSNAILECLMEGVPVMAFGPSIGITAGAVKQASLNTFEKDLKEMVDGWHPEEYNVRNYLYWLASRQWNRKEFATKKLFEALSSGDVRIEMEP